MDSFCNAAAFKTRALLIVIRTTRTFCTRDNVVLLMRLSMSCLACSFFFVVITSYFPDIDDRYFFPMFMTDKSFSSFFLKSRIHNILVYIVVRDDCGIMNELIL